MRLFLNFKFTKEVFVKFSFPFPCVWPIPGEGFLFWNIYCFFSLGFFFRDFQGLLFVAWSKRIHVTLCGQLHQHANAQLLHTKMLWHWTSILPTILCQTLPEHSTRSYSQTFTLYALCLVSVRSAYISWHKSCF